MGLQGQKMVGFRGFVLFCCKLGEAKDCWRVARRDPLQREGLKIQERGRVPNFSWLVRTL